MTYIWDKEKPPVDTEHIIIDSERILHIPENIKRISVVGDNNAETLLFVMDRSYKNTDLINKKCMARFVNAQNEYGEDDIEVSIYESDDDSKILLKWNLTNEVTRYPGIAQFTIQFEDNEKYQWQSKSGKLIIRQALPIDSTAIVEKDDSTFRQLATQLQNVESKVFDLEDDVAYIANDFDFTLDE